MTSSAPLLHLLDVEVGYPSSPPLLNGISFQIEAGECLLMMGLNGMGKTTLMHTALNQHPLSKGQILLSGEAHTRARSRRHLAYLPEHFTPPLEWSAHDFLKSAATLYGCDFAEAAVHHALHETLGHSESSRTRALLHASKGMRQHVSLLSLFLSQRPLWLLDEPLNGLDWKARIWAYQHMQRHLEQGGAIWMTSHDLTGISQLRPRWGLLHQKAWKDYGILEDTELVLAHLAALIPSEAHDSAQRT